MHSHFIFKWLMICYYILFVFCFIIYYFIFIIFQVVWPFKLSWVWFMFGSLEFSAFPITISPFWVLKTKTKKLLLHFVGTRHWIC